MDPIAAYRLSDSEIRRTESFFTARRIPPAVEHAVERYIAQKTGKPYDDQVVLERLQRAIVAQKDDYWKAPHRRRLAYRKGYNVMGYLAYHFPVYFMQAEHILQDLAVAGLLKREMTVLDIGSGPGVVPLAVADFCSRLDSLHATVHSVEISEEHIEAFRFLEKELAPGFRNAAILPPLQEDIRAIGDQTLPGPADLLVFSNVINEFESLRPDRQAEIVLRFAQRVAPDGTILIVEPAEEFTATRLRAIARILQDRGLTIHSPCSFPWGTRCDPSRCWSFTTQPDIRPTRLMEALASGKDGYRYVNTDIKYAYVILRKDGLVRHPYRVPSRAKVSRLSKLHQHAGRRINVVAAKMSQDLGDKKIHVFRLCDGTAAKPVYAVLPEYHRGRSNDPLIAAPYGAILEFGQVLVRYNKRYDAYNLLVNRTTGVRSGTPPNLERTCTGGRGNRFKEFLDNQPE